MRQFFRAIRLLMVFAPVTTIVYNVFFFMLMVEVVAGENIVSSLLPIDLDSAAVKSTIADTLKGYLSLLSDYSGTLMYFILFMIMLILAVPLFMTFIAIGTIVYAGKMFVIPLIIDGVFLFVKCIFSGKNPLAIISARYRILFPGIGKKINEKSYSRWLSRHHDEFEQDTFKTRHKKTPLEEFYREDDDIYYEEEDIFPHYNEHDFYYEDEYDDEFLEDDEPDEDEYLFYESKEDYYDNRIEDKHKKHTGHKNHLGNSENDVSAFNFFAGCTTMESATKKYRSLVKLYHPDNLDGDTTALQEINAQYNEIKKRLS